tara:strand:+ start:929 stop:2146 length:1218 start_codon:yes stop_codon:yes gene_type:complete
MKNTIAFLVSTSIPSILNSLNNDKSIIYELKKKKEKIYILDLSNFVNINNSKLDLILKEYYGDIFIVIKIKNYKDLKDFIYKKNLIFINYVPPGLFQNQYKIWRIIKKFNLKIVQVQNDQIRALTEQTSSINIKKNFSQKFKKKYNYYLFRILVILNFFPKICIVFVSSKKIRNSFNNSIFKKIDNFLNINLFSFFLKIELTNIKFYNIFLFKQLEEKYITYIDTAPFDHPALNLHSNEIIDNNKRKFFYNNLCNALKKIKKITNKKIIICLHPKYNLKHKKKDFNDLVCKTHESEKYILKSSLVIFQSSSMITQAMILKKKIIQINSDFLPNYFKSEVNNWNKIFNFTLLNIDLYNKLDLYGVKSILKNAKKKITFYQKFNKKIIHKININPADQIINLLEKYK